MNYWEKRAAQKQALIDAMDNKAIRDIFASYNRAIDQLDTDIEKIISTYTRKTGLTPQEARAFLNEGVTPIIREMLTGRAYGITDPVKRQQFITLLNTDAYRARITRIQAIQLDTRMTMYQVADMQIPDIKQHLKSAADLTYSQTMYDVQKVSGIGFKMDGVADIESLLKSRWSGNNFSNRVWNNTGVVADRMKSVLFEQATIGKLSDASVRELRGYVDLEKWRKQLTSKFKTEQQYAKYATNGLLRTETAYICNEMNAQVYDEAGVKKYVFIAVLDSRTSEKCADHDGKEYLLTEKEVGVNFPPLHPRCRSTTGAVIDTGVREGLTRRARDANGKSTLVPRDMWYAEWKRWQEAGAPADINAWRAR